MKDFIPESLKRVIEMQNRFKAQIPNITALDRINQIMETNRRFAASVPKIELPKGLISLIEQQTRLEVFLPKLNIPDFSYIEKFKIPDYIRKIGETIKRINEHPESQFSFLTNFELLNISTSEELKLILISDYEEEDIEEKEMLLNENLVPALEKLDLEELWNGANYVLNDKNNPDRLRHCLISLRTLLEYIIDHKLAPKSDLKDSELFRNEFKQYRSGKKELSEINGLNRKKKIEYFTSKIDFWRIEFTRNDIDFICGCYSVLCNIHEPKIGITENQVRSLKVKTGITIWFLVHIHNMIEMSKN
ncbi:MAG: hypothetical protein WBG43_01415 [Marinifilaceae bacterium]